MSKEFFDGTGILTSSRSCYTSPEDCQIPTKLSELENDMNFIRDAQYQHTDNNFTDEYKEILDQSKDLPQAVEDAKNAADRANAAADISETLNENPPKIVNDYWWFYNIDTGRYENTGIKAIGDSFVIKRTYSSVQEMEDNFNSPDVLVGEFVVINTEDIEDPENSRLYMKAEESWKFITDLSGATGVTGLSAYQIAVQHGFEGTEEEWLESLSKDSKDAAKEAKAAAESANTATEGANTAAGTANQAATSANQAAINATTQADRAKEFADNPPKIEGGTWWVWDENNDSYTNTGVSATGPKGDTGSGLNIIGELNSESELPAEGKSGDAYLINGQLYVYVGSGGNVSSNPKWSNVGTIKGDKGDAATIEVGNVTSGDVAKITNSGTSSAAIFDFVLPKGDAATIKVGTVTEGESAKITNSGNEHEAIFDFVLPSGEPGKSPKIQGGTWWVWSWEENDYVNTNISVSSDYELTKEKVENVLIGDITTHNHDSSYIKDAPKDSRYYGRQEGTWKILDDVFIKQESDPTVPEWAKQPNKPQYTAQEVGALPSDTEIPDISGLATKAELESKADVSSLNGKVDKIEGKGLSTEDFTTENKNDLNKLKSNLDWTTVE